MLIAAPKDDLCLAFANTRYWRGRGTPTETLSGIDDLLAWLMCTAKLPVSAIEVAGRQSRRHRLEAEALFAEAIALRESIYGVFTAIAASQSVHAKDFALVNRVLAKAP